MDIKIYGFWRSIASFRVRVALRLKGLPFEEIPIDILSGEQFEPDYAAVNAERVVPTFIHDGHSVFQSLAIIEYLDEIQPTPRLIPQDANERAFGADAKAIADWGTHWTMEGLATYERMLASRAPAPFALGSEPGLADICIAGQVVGAQYLKLELGAFPAVARLAERCFAMPAFATSHPFEQPGYKAAGAAH
jgi:maleylpyruvate isomerase